LRAELLPASALRGPSGAWLGGILGQDLRAPDGSVILRKGHRLERADDVSLDAAEARPLHLVFLEAGDVDEDEAAERLALAVAGRGVERGRPVESQVTCRALWRGLVTVDQKALQELNRQPDVTVFTLPDGMPVEAGRAVAGVKVTPLGVPESMLLAAERSLAELSGPVLDVRSFLPLRVGVVVCEALDRGRRERFEAALRRQVSWFGGSLTRLDYLPQREFANQAELRAMAAGCDLLLVAGVASTDPLDAPWVALMAAGARPVRRGLPVHPGSSYWVAELEGCTAVGVSSCGMFSRRTVLDILLARRFAGGRLDGDYLSSLGHGGLLARELSYHFPDYARGEEEPA